MEITAVEVLQSTQVFMADASFALFAPAPPSVTAKVMLFLAAVPVSIGLIFLVLMTIHAASWAWGWLTRPDCTLCQDTTMVKDDLAKRSPWNFQPFMPCPKCQHGQASSENQS